MSAESIERETTTAQETPGETAEPEELSKDVLFEILKNQRRRDALQYLKEQGGTAKLSDMAEYIAAKENDIEVEALSSSQRKRVYIGLYQCHLPKMDSAGVITFDKNRGDIEIRESATQLDPFLDGDVAEADTPSKRNLYIALGVMTAVSAGLVGAPGFAMVSDAGWAVVSALALVVLTAFETFETRLT